MKKFQINHMSEIPLEGTHDLPDSRQTLATKDDIIIIPAGSKHKFVAGGDSLSTFYFVRIKV